MTLITDTRYKNIKHGSAQYNDIQHNDTHYYDT
jgi:hypothetical protein